MLGHQEGATHIYIMYEVKALHLHILCIVQRYGRCIVYQYVYTAKHRYGLPYGIQHLLFIAYIALHGQRFAACLIYFLCCAVYGAAQAGVFRYRLCYDHYISALSCQSQCYSLTYASAGTGNKSGLSFKQHTLIY